MEYGIGEATGIILFTATGERVVKPDFGFGVHAPVGI
jgi:phage baseplate assembly protein W